MRHALVTPKTYFEEVLTGKRTAEIKKDDRPYKFGDEIILQEFDTATKLYTGRELSLTITSVARNIPREGLRRGFVFMCFAAGTLIENEMPEGYGVSQAGEEKEEAAENPIVESLSDIPEWLKEKSTAAAAAAPKAEPTRGGGSKKGVAHE